MKAIVTGLVTFVGFVVVLYYGVITRWTFVPRENTATGVGLLQAYAPYVFGIAAIGGIIVAMLVYRFMR